MHHPGFDIRRHAFTRAVRGVDESEVEAALHDAAPAYDEAHAILQELQQALADTLAERDRLLEAERSVIKLIRAAEEQARMRIGGAHRDAARVVERADAQARELLAGVEVQRAMLLRETEVIEQRRQHLVATVAEFVDAMAAKPSAPLVPDAVTTLSQLTENAWPLAVERQQEEPSAALSWTMESDQAVEQEALEQFPTGGVDLEETTVTTDVEPEAELSTAWPAEEERGSRRSWPQFSARHALAAAAAVVMLAAAIATPAVRGWTGTSPRTSRPPAASSPALAASFVPEPAAATEAPPAPATAFAAPEPSSVNPFADAVPLAPLTIKLTATRSCWVGVTIDGAADSVLLEPGDELERSASKQIRLRIGDAAAATLVVNGQALPPLGKSGQVVDRTFTAENVAR